MILAPTDAVDFLNSTGAWSSGANGVTTTGLDVVDLWIGGLAEKILPFGGMLGSTFNFVFENQMESLQNGDRFYYLQRLDGLHLFGEMENNSFAEMIMTNTNATHLPSDVFSTPGLILEVDQSRQFNDLDGDGDLESADPTGGGILTPLVVRNNPSTVRPGHELPEVHGRPARRARRHRRQRHHHRQRRRRHDLRRRRQRQSRGRRRQRHHQRR